MIITGILDAPLAYNNILSFFFDRPTDPSIDRRSIDDRSIDREDLIICIASWTLYKLCGPLICDKVGMIPIASRNKLRFTSLLGLVFKDFGRPNSVFEFF